MVFFNFLNFIGSVCKRNGNPDQIEDILLAIKAQRPDLQLHGFGIKFHALQSPTVRQLLYSSDSMAWSFAGRKHGTEHDPRIALAYAAKIEALIGQPSFVQPQLFHWWNETDSIPLIQSVSCGQASLYRNRDNSTILEYSSRNSMIPV